MSWLFSQALVEAFSEAGSLDGEPSAQLNVMPTAQPFWRSGKPINASNLSRFGLTLRLLTADRGEELLTSYLAAFRAKTSASQAQETDLTESAADSGGKWRASFAKFDRAASTWRTPQCSLLEDSGEFSQTWPQSGSMRNGECYQRPTLELHTSANGSGLLPTPVTIDTWSRFNRSASDGAANRPTLGAMARYDLWPTPTVHGNYNRKGASKTSGDGIATAVRWRTPNASDGRKWSNQSLQERMEKGQQIRLNTQVSPEGGAGGKLNPNWVEWLMGWPIGWTALQPLAMDKFRSWLQQHGGC